VCSEFINIVLVIPAGQKFLLESRLFHEIAEKISNLANPAFMDYENIFSKQRMATTLSREYFMLLGLLQNVQQGLMILDECSIWTLFYSLTDLRGREDILKAVITSANYDHDHHFRIIFQKMLTSGYKEMRLFTTNHLNLLLECKSKGFNDWVPQLLASQVNLF
jgi:large subunit ribosomal protein L17e